MGKTSPRNDLTFEQVNELLEYNPDTGVFRWKVSRGSARKGAETGCLNKAGYQFIGLYGRVYLAHRLAHLLQTGEWPEEDVDHRDLNRSNNRWDNLRACSRSENLQNTPTPYTNTSGFKGVSRDKKPGWWRASIRLGGRHVHLGSFRTAKEAGLAYAAAARRRNSEYARF